jgi:hypothetical protein
MKSSFKGKGGPPPKRPAPPKSIGPARPGGIKPPARPAPSAPRPAMPPKQPPAAPKTPAPPIQRPPQPVKPPIQKAPPPAVQRVPRPQGAPGVPKVSPPAQKAPYVPQQPLPKTSAERIQIKQQRQQQRYSYLVGPAIATGAGAAVLVGEAARQQLDTLSSHLATLQQAASLSDVYADLDETESTLAFLPGEIANLRTQGYVFANYLEHKADVLAQQWANVRQQVTAAITQHASALQTSVSEAEQALQMAYSSGGAGIARAQSAIQQLESKVSAAQRAIEAMYKTIDDNVTQLMQQIERIQWVLDQAREASFPFYEGEDFVSACRAKYFERPEESMTGILHLTTDRIIFERKEEVATKKFLFITTEKQTVHEFIFDELVGHIEQVKASQKGFLGGREALEILFAPDADIAEAQLELLNADNDEWMRLIDKVRRGEIERERVQPEGAEPTAEAPAIQVSQVPTRCTNCGAALTAPVVRGMREITCEYCGMIYRL